MGGGISEKVDRAIVERIVADLDPPNFIVHLKIAVSILVGGGVSLFFCGQFGMSLSPFAEAIQGRFEEIMGMLGCSVTCGIVFASLPVLVLRAMTSASQFYVLTRKKWSCILGWFTLSGITLINLAETPFRLVEAFSWISAAMFMFVTLAWLIHHMASQMNLWRGHHV